MTKGLFDYSSEEEVNSFSEEENELGSKSLPQSIYKTVPTSSPDWNVRSNLGVNVNMSCSDSLFCNRNLSGVLNSDDDDSDIENSEVKNSGKVEFLSSNLRNINITRENGLREAKLMPIELRFGKKKESKGLFDDVSATESEESNESSDLTDRSLNTRGYIASEGLARHPTEMESMNRLNDNENSNHKWYFEEQRDALDSKISSQDIKRDTKEQFTLVSLQETYLQSCRVMKSVFADLDEGSGNSLKGEEIKSSHAASKLSLQKVQNEYKPVGQLEEKINLANVLLLTGHAKTKEIGSPADILKENGRYCHQKHFVRRGQNRCQETCDKLKDCKIHRCDLPCEFPHYSHKCSEEVMRKLSCGHEINVSCGQTTTTERCNAKTKTTFKCGHEGVGKCGQASTMNCGGRIKTKLACGHSTVYTCNGGKTNCHERCPKKLACGHGCPNLCSDPCIPPAQCQLCIDLDEETQNRRRQMYQDQAKQKALEFRIEATKFKIVNLDPSSSVFLDVNDKVVKYIQPAHSWHPEVTSVQEVFNANLLEAFYSCQASLFDPSSAREKFHGTDADACEKIVHNGFRLPRNDGIQRMFGCGIYFATDSSKSAQKVYTKGSNLLILCDVLLGKQLKVSAHHYQMNLETIRSLGYDSIFAPRDTKSVGGVLFDEFVIYDPRQAYPKYVINYKVTQLGISVDNALSTKFQVHEILPSRSFDSSNELDYHFRVAEAQFRRLCKTREVIKVTYVLNPKLESEFAKTIKQFQKKYGANSEEAKPILAFHGTPVESNIQSILQNNFQSSYIKQTVYGYGHYFSEFPDVALGYAKNVKALILCKVLAGRSQDVTSRVNIAEGYDSNRVDKDALGRGKMIIINNDKQILPRYVVHLN
ncbi:uncharacterized protein LOC136031445 [Artemia franciscana]